MQVLEYRVNALGHLRHPGKDLFFGVAIDQHAGTPPCACFFFYPYSLTSPAFFHTVTFPSLVHMVSSRSTGPISHRILVLRNNLFQRKSLCLYYLFSSSSFTTFPLHNIRDGIDIYIW